MNGAQTLVQTLVNCGVQVCFANPGTSEMHFVAALDRVDGMRCVLGLFEGVVTGAADGYARMRGKPAATLLHLGPGLSNGLANLHNAKRGWVPMVNVVGDHAAYHLQHDAPLTSHIEAVAAPMSHWVRLGSDVDELPKDCLDAVAAANTPPGHVATLILPANVSWAENAPAAGEPRSQRQSAPVDEDVIANAISVFETGEPVMILLGGVSLLDEVLTPAGRIAEKTQSRLACEPFPRRLSRGAGHVAVERMPYLGEHVTEFLGGIRHLILVGARPPVSFFAYPNKPSWLTPENCQVHDFASAQHDIPDALNRLCQALGAGDVFDRVTEFARPASPAGALNPASAAQGLAARLPEDSIVVDEGITAGAPSYTATAAAPAHDWMTLTGGSIGWGLPAAVGAAIACSERKVVCLEGDGSAMYTIQALWTMARENLDIITIIYANRSYAILEFEFGRVDAGEPGERARKMLTIDDPELDFVGLARSQGVSACRVKTCEEFDEALADAFDQRGPHLIEVVISGFGLA